VIDPAQIKKKAIARYPNFLTSLITGESFFPLQLPIGKRPKDFLALRDAVTQLQNQSKQTLGFGYTLHLETKRTHDHHRQSLPTQIYFDNGQDYLKFIQKEAEVSQFKQDIELIRKAVPELEDWLCGNAIAIIKHSGQWPDLLKVCQYFQQNPQPNLYIRELPVSVHTKFVEQHKKVLRSLLEALLPNEQLTDITNEKDNIFEKRFALKYAETSIRLRFLDADLQQKCGFPVTDISLPLSSFEQLRIVGHRCIITENQMNFLTLPTVQNGFALFGSGYAVQSLQFVTWLSDCDVFYWGDLDAQGFQILSQLRSHVPKTQSVMMDQSTLQAFESFIVTDKKAKLKMLPHLTESEQVVYHYLATHQLRLEQEHILQSHVNQILQVLCAKT